MLNFDFLTVKNLVLFYIAKLQMAEKNMKTKIINCQRQKGGSLSTDVF